MLKIKDLVHRIEPEVTLYKSLILVWVFCSYIDDNTGKVVIKKYSSLENAVVDDVRTFCCSVHVLFQFCFKKDSIVLVNAFAIFCGWFQVKILGNDDGTGTLQRVSIKLRIQVSLLVCLFSFSYEQKQKRR